MKRNRTRLLPLAAFGLIFLAGCVATSGQIVISFDINDKTITSTGVDGQQIDLNDNSDYNDHKSDLAGLADLAVVGEVTNHASSPIDVEVWMTSDASGYTTDSDVRAHGFKLWGPFHLGASAVTTIDWDVSAGLFDASGKGKLLTEVKGEGGAAGDGNFTIYLLGPAATTYNFSVQDGSLVLVLDAGL